MVIIPPLQTMIATFSHHYRRPISTALLVVMVLSVLQFCMMSVAEGQGSAHKTHSSSEAVMAEDMSDSTMDCCSVPTTSDSGAKMVMSCPDCDDSDPAFQASLAPDLKPLLTLLYYVVMQEVQNDTQKTRIWQVFTEPDILSSLPDIYLAKATFLE